MADWPEKERLARLALRLKATEAIAELPERIEMEVRETVTRGGVRVTVIATPTESPEPTGLPPLVPLSTLKSTCEHDLMAALRSLGATPDRRFTFDQIERELDRAGKLHGTSTIQHALARLVRAGLVKNDHDRRGYGLPSEHVQS